MEALNPIDAFALRSRPDQGACRQRVHGCAYGARRFRVITSPASLPIADHTQYLYCTRSRSSGGEGGDPSGTRDQDFG